MIYQDLDEAGDRPAVRKSRNAMHKLSGVSSLMLITGKLMLMLFAHADHGQALLPIQLVEVPTILPSLVSPLTLD